MPRVAALTPILDHAWRPAFAALLGIASSVALAQPVPAAAASSSPQREQDPAAWLRLMGQAARQGSYDGVALIQTSGQSSAVQVSHRFDGVSQYERVAPLDGPEREIFRHNDEVRVLWPQTRTAVLQQRSAGGGAPLADADERVLDWYQVRVLGQQRWAGHPAIVLQLQPRDEYRFAQRVWAERRSGLVLRADTMTPQGQVLEWTGFLQVALAPQGSKALAMPDDKALSGWRLLHSSVRKTTLDGEGWAVQALPPGFRLLGCLRRAGGSQGDLSATAAAGEAAQVPSKPPSVRPPEVVHAIFGDGVAHVSVFIEPFDPARHRREMQLGRGATQTLKRRAGDWWLTVVGDVPAATVQRFAAAFQRR